MAIDGRATTRERLRVAVIGAGYFSQYHLDGWSRLPGVEIAAICDLDADRARTRADHFGVRQVFDDAATMLDAVSPDLVDIITPEATHLELISETTARHLPTICQKPFARDLASAIALVELAESTHTPLIVHENTRWNAWYQESNRLITDGALGAPHTIAFRLRPGDGQGAQAYLDRQPYFQKMDHFLIHETGIHYIDIFRFLMGEIAGVFARLRRLNPAIAGEDAGYVLFEFENGSVGLFDGSRFNDHNAEDPLLTMGEMIVEGSEAVLRLDGNGRLWVKPHAASEFEHEFAWARRGCEADCVFTLQQHIVSRLSDDGRIVNTAREYLKNVRVEEAIYHSAESGTWEWVVDPDTNEMPEHRVGDTMPAAR